MKNLMSFLKKLEDKKGQSLRPGKLKGLPLNESLYIEEKGQEVKTYEKL